jgi:hypothetical protein
MTDYSSSAVEELALPVFRVFTKHPKISIVNLWVYEKETLQGYCAKLVSLGHEPRLGHYTRAAS